MIGNSSSGIMTLVLVATLLMLEMAEGRCCSDNVFHVSGEAESIKKVVTDIQKLRYNEKNIYFNQSE